MGGPLNGDRTVNLLEGIWLVVWNMAFINFHSVGNHHPN